MAKKLPRNEQPYEPVKVALVESVIRPVAPPGVLEHPPVKPASVPHRETPAAPIARPVEARQAAEAEKPHRVDVHERVEGAEHERELSSTPKLQLTARQTIALDADRLVREKRCLLTRVEEIELEALVQRIAQELKTSVKFSHVLRAAMQVIRHAEDEIILAARAMGPVARPANSDATKLAEFELRLAALLSSALRRAPPLRG
jgi:hypothetical protein